MMARRWSPTAARILLALLLIVAIARAAASVARARTDKFGDFYQTLPGAYARTVNPTLWDSPDLQNSFAFHRDIYLYGPTQYLTLYPVVFLNSYAQVATVLLFVYGAAVACALVLMWRTLNVGEPGSRASLAVVVALSLLFYPLLQAYGQREFEIVVFVFLVGAQYLIVTERPSWAAALLGYITWFKLWPVLFVAYFAVRRQFRAVLVFAAVAAATVATAHLIFGLDKFVIFNAPTDLGVGYREWTRAQFPPATLAAPVFSQPWVGRLERGTGFCGDWDQVGHTMVSFRTAICTISYHHRWFHGTRVFYAALLSVALLTCLAFMRAERLPHPTAAERKWRVVFEFSLLTLGGAFILRSHYYYFVLLLFPIVALAYRYWTDGRWGPMACLGMVYFTLGAFVVPVSVSSRWLPDEFWSFYANNVIYLYGELLITGLLLFEYFRIRRSSVAAA